MNNLPFQSSTTPTTPQAAASQETMKPGKERQPLYRLTGLQKQYSGRSVLNLSDLIIYEGEILAIIGPSGSGKSTLLRLLNFLETPSRGELEFQGQSYQPGAVVPLEARRRVTTVFQRPILLNRTVQDNVAYGLNLRGINNAQSQILQALTLVGMEKLARQRALTLSGGEAQRIALARAIIFRPDVLLLDEPTANLDPYNIGLIEKILENLNHEQGTTLVLVTHHIFQARRLSQRVGLLLDGQLVEIANRDDFFNNPVDERTKAFVHGEMIY